MFDAFIANFLGHYDDPWRCLKFLGLASQLRALGAQEILLCLQGYVLNVILRAGGGGKKTVRA